jgi:hypothetical protein
MFTGFSHCGKPVKPFPNQISDKLTMPISGRFGRVRKTAFFALGVGPVAFGRSS